MGRGPRHDGSDPLDRETLERVRRRDVAAMNRFFEAYYDRVHDYAARLLRDAPLAEDLAQEAFLRMHRAIDRIDPELDPTPWVFTIVTNVIRDHWKSRAHRTAKSSVSLDDAWDLAAPEGPGDPGRSLERRESAAAVHAAMGRIAPGDREILLLRAFDELETTEIMEILGISADAVRQRYSRALKRLGAALGKRPEGA